MIIKSERNTTIKKMITSAALLAALITSIHASAPAAYEFEDVFNGLKAAQQTAQADFKCGDVFNDLKVAQEDTQVNFKFGDVFKNLEQ